MSEDNPDVVELRPRLEEARRAMDPEIVKLLNDYTEEALEGKIDGLVLIAAQGDEIATGIVLGEASPSDLIVAMESLKMRMVLGGMVIEDAE